jgi:hypothetical protein
MKNQVIFICFLLLSGTLFGQARKKADEDTENWRYEIEGQAEGKDGSYVVKVWSYSKKKDVAIEQAKKNAVHGIIFQGFTGAGKVSSQPPIARTPGLEIEKADFFKTFFADNGPYMKYVSVTNDGSIDPNDRLKVGKEYKIGVLVSVKKDLLKKDLQAQGIIKAMGAGLD